MSELRLNVYQADFLHSKLRFPALISGIATGKTYMLLLKVWKYCEDYPDSLALVVRKEFTDLRDSTMKDFEKYFGVTVSSNKEYRMPNGSTIMFRHASEIEVLKNINLSIFAIEQAEEFDSEEVFTFLRDRLRRESGPYRQGMLIANANGHNWMWKLWVNNPPSLEYDLTTATTFDNLHNLPPDYIQDLEAMKVEAPSHYNRFVMNSFEETDEGDLVVPFSIVEESLKHKFIEQGGSVLSVDVARYGQDRTAFTVLKRADAGFKQIYMKAINGHDLMQTVGQVVDLRRIYSPSFVVIDDGGVGGGVTDRLIELNIESVMAFNGANKAINTELYSNRRAECYWKIRELLEQGRLQLLDDNELITELTSIKFKYRSGGEKLIESKDDMRKRGLRSPDKADALMMCMSVIDQISEIKEEAMTVRVYAPQKYTYRPTAFRSRKPV
jgi:hypothetical protein